MSTKNVTTQTSAFAPSGMNAYNAMMPQMQQVLQSFMQDPQKAGYLNMLLQQSLGGARQLGARNMQNITGNLAAGGFGGENLPAFLQSQFNKAGRATSGMESNAFIQNLLNSANLKMQAAGTASGFRPLQTGQTSVQQQSGLGTWLPTLLSAGLGMATGGLSGLGAGLFGALTKSPTLPGTMNALSMGPEGPNWSPGVGTMPSAPSSLFMSPMGGIVPPPPAPNVI